MFFLQPYKNKYCPFRVVLLGYSRKMAPLSYFILAGSSHVTLVRHKNELQSLLNSAV